MIPTDMKYKDGKLLVLDEKNCVMEYDLQLLMDSLGYKPNLIYNATYISEDEETAYCVE
jgi:hypothetical protein